MKRIDKYFFTLLSITTAIMIASIVLGLPVLVENCALYVFLIAMLLPLVYKPLANVLKVDTIWVGFK